MLYSIKQFIKYGVHIGHYKWESDYRLSYYLLGTRNSIHILNLYYTLFILKQALYITYNNCLLGQKLLVANNAGYKLESIFENINKIVNQNQLWYINSKWIGGLISNQRELLLNNEKFFLKSYGLGYNSILPSYVFASNVKETKSCIFEAMVLNIPCSTLMDSNMGLYGIYYGLPSNDDNYVGIYMFSRLFIKIYLKTIYDNINILNIEKDLRIEKGINDINIRYYRYRGKIIYNIIQKKKKMNNINNKFKNSHLIEKYYEKKENENWNIYQKQKKINWEYKEEKNKIYLKYKGKGKEKELYWNLEQAKKGWEKKSIPGGQEYIKKYEKKIW